MSGELATQGSQRQIVIIRRDGFTITPSGQRRHCALIQCHCGTVKRVNLQKAKAGIIKSCGCDQYRSGVRRVEVRQIDHPLRPIYTGMRTRCENPKHKYFHYYGGRGVSVCERWRQSFWGFVKDVGERPSPNHTLDRFPNNSGNYEPGNIRWATWQQQASNRRRTK